MILILVSFQEGKNILLIPYEPKHVPMYNGWLQSEEIQTLTETEPCTLSEEYEYQKSWEEDNQQTSNILIVVELF